MVSGADLVQRQQWFLIPASVALSFSVLVAAPLLINGFPDAEADTRVEKRTLVVQLGPTTASLLYLALVVSSHLWLGLTVMWLIPPAEAPWGLVSAPLSLMAASLLWLQRHQPQHLQLSVTALLVHGLAMTAGFAWLGWNR